MKKALMILASLAASTIAVGAQANPESVESVTVTYNDLNLSTQDGVNKLDHRLRNAVGEVCDSRLEQVPLSEHMAIRRCMRQTWQDIQESRQLAIARERARKFEPSVMVGQADPAPALLQVAKAH